MTWADMRGWSAGKVLNHLQMATPPINVVHVAQHLGVNLVYFDHLNYDVAVASGRPANLWLHKDRPLVNQRFSIAHALGHLLHHDLTKPWIDSKFSGSELEMEANRFASDLLTPAPLLYQYGPQCGWDPTEMASLFQVSTQMMEIRLQYLA